MRDGRDRHGRRCSRCSGRRLGGNRVGILAALAGAIYPNLWINDGMLMSETLFVFFIALALLCAYRYWDAPSLKRALLLSVTMTIAVMTRSEGLLLLPLVVAPVIVVHEGLGLGQAAADARRPRRWRRS